MSNQVCFHVCICFCFFVWLFIIQMFHFSSRGKEQVINLTSSPVSKRTRHSSNDFDNKKFKTFSDTQSFFNNFKSAPTVVERVVSFDTLGSMFILKIFVDKD